MSDLTIKYPPDFERTVRLTKEEFEAHVRLMAALKMFELGKISSGKAAEFSGMSRVDFLEACGRYKVSFFNYDEEDLENEISHDLETLNKFKAK
jgi:predicted HTH domain antitoxin